MFALLRRGRSKAENAGKGESGLDKPASDTKEQVQERFGAAVQSANTEYWHRPEPERTLAGCLRAAKIYSPFLSQELDEQVKSHAAALQGILLHEAYVLAKRAGAQDLAHRYLNRACDALEHGKDTVDPAAKGWAIYILCWTYLQRGEPDHAESLLADVMMAAESWDVPPERLGRLAGRIAKALAERNDTAKHVELKDVSLA
ncbi:MAG: hypothetical protein ACP5OR_07630 [Candidatus Dormibacteria bacterium]